MGQFTRGYPECPLYNKKTTRPINIHRGRFLWSRQVTPQCYLRLEKQFPEVNQVRWLDVAATKKTAGWLVTLWLCQNSYWKWPVIVDLPIESMVIFQFVMGQFTRPGNGRHNMRHSILEMIRIFGKPYQIYQLTAETSTSTCGGKCFHDWSGNLIEIL